MHTHPGQSARHGLAMSPDRSRMRAFVQIVGGVVLGLGRLLPEDPDAVAGRHDRSCPRSR